jgi:DNA polymerase III subunit beta
MASALIEVDEASATLRCSAFNGEIGVVTEAPLSEITTPGRITAPGALLTGLAARLPDASTATLRESSRGLEVAAGGAQYDLSIDFGADEFPALPEFPADAPALGLTATALHDAIGFVNFAAKTADTTGHPEIECLCLSVKNGAAEIAGMDGHRLAVAPIAGGDGEGRIMLPVAFVSELHRCLSRVGDDDSIELAFTDSLVRASFDSMTLIGRLQAGDYPPYRKLLPKSYSNEFSVDRDELINAIERVNLIAAQLQGTILIDFSSEDKTLTITAENDRGGGVEDLIADVGMGKGMKVCAAAQYVLDAVKRLPGERITFLMNGPQQPVKLTSDEVTADMIQIVMPRAVREGQS